MHDDLDRMICRKIHVLRAAWAALPMCRHIGLALASSMTVALIACLGLSPWVLALVILSAATTFFVLVMLTKIVTGGASIVYCHHEIAVVIASVLLLKLLHQPVLSYLDVTSLGIGIFLVCGRVSCLMVGCGHGRPHSDDGRRCSPATSKSMEAHYAV